MTINELAAAAHENAVAHGWWDNPPSFGEIVALCHSELSEALQEYRDHKPLLYGTCAINPEDCKHHAICDNVGDPLGKIRNPDGEVVSIVCKPEGAAVEMADCLLRILDWFGAEGLDAEAIIKAKHDYNVTRSFRHGGKAL